MMSVSVISSHSLGVRFSRPPLSPGSGQTHTGEVWSVTCVSRGAVCASWPGGTYRADLAGM